MFFEKVSFKEWEKTIIKFFPLATTTEIINAYDEIIIPKVSTEFSAGHDFFMPLRQVDFVSNSTLLIPTGIRWVTESQDKNLVMLLCPRSGLGTKYGMHLVNTIGVIDADYCTAANEGHIMATICCKNDFTLKRGEKFMQGIIIPYYRCGQASTETRTGGFGSTGV